MSFNIDFLSIACVGLVLSVVTLFWLLINYTRFVSGADIDTTAVGQEIIRRKK